MDGGIGESMLAADAIGTDATTAAVTGGLAGAASGVPLAYLGVDAGVGADVAGISNIIPGVTDTAGMAVPSSTYALGNDQVGALYNLTNNQVGGPNINALTDPSYGLTGSPDVLSTSSMGSGSYLPLGTTLGSGSYLPAGAVTANSPSFLEDPTGWITKNPKTAAALGLGAYGLANWKGLTTPGTLPAYTPASAASYGLGSMRGYNYRPTFAAASGGIASLAPMSLQDTPSYVTPNQMPAGAVSTMKSGGVTDLGSYSDGGRMLKGPGDGMSDSIPANIDGKRPARLADGEFVVPADVVSHLGNGSTDAGAKHLYSMMNKIRKARTGTTEQGKQINPNKYMPT